MLFHDDVVAHRETKPSAFACRLGRKERIEHLFLYFGRNAGAVIANADLHGIAEIPGGRMEHRLKPWANLQLALVRRIESIRDQVQECAGDFLRKYVGRTRRLVEVALQGNIELALLGACAVIGQIETLIQQRIDVGGPMLAGAFARMQQHVLDDGVGALAVLDDFFEIVLEHAGQLADFLAHLVGERG